MLLNRQQSKLFTSIAQMHRNTVIIYRGDRLNFRSGMSFFTPQMQFLRKVRKKGCTFHIWIWK